MNTLSKYVLLLLVSVLAACGSDDDAAATFTPGTPQPGDALAVTITASDFVTDGDPDTRATDSGPVTTFEDGDRVGIIILDKDKQPLYNNIPYKYVSSSQTWEFDNGNGEGKEICYYDSKAHTYIVYYPYSAKADDCKSESDLKAIFKPQTDQSRKEAYRASDLMAKTTTSATPLKSLTAELKHVYASISLAPTAYTLDDGKNTKGNAKVSDVNLTIGDNFYVPYQATDGSLRCIVPTDITPSGIRCFYTFRGITYGNTINISAPVAANTRYTSAPEIISEKYTLADAKVGDFYCKKNENEGYLIPGEVALTDGQKKACIGIVFWVGDEALNDDHFLKQDHHDCSHGLVVALQDAALNSSITMNWSSQTENVQNWVKGNNTYKDYVNVQEMSKMCGYSNTLALKAYNEAKGEGNGLRVLPCDAIQQYSKNNPTPTNSSGWYFPSVMELQYVCRGQGKNGGTAGRDDLNTQIGVSGGSPFGSDHYWSSTEASYGSSDAWNMYFGSGYVLGSSKYNYAFRVRPLLAF